MATTKSTQSPSQATYAVVMLQSEYGTHEPSLQVAFPRGTSYRTVKAELYRLASLVELHSAGENWVVIVRPHNTDSCRGRVLLELSKGTDAEAQRGFRSLEFVLAKAR